MRHLHHAVEELHHDGCVAAVLQVVLRKAAQGFHARVGLRAWAEHYALQQVHIQRVGFGGLVIGEQRELRITVVGLGGKHVAVSVECHFVMPALLIEVTEQHAVAQVEREGGAEVFDRLVSQFRVVGFAVKPELFKTYFFARSVQSLYLIEGADSGGVVLAHFVELHQSGVVLRRRPLCRHLLEERQRFCHASCAYEVSPVDLLVIAVVRREFHGACQQRVAFAAQQGVGICHALRLQPPKFKQGFRGIGVYAQRLAQQPEHSVVMLQLLLPRGFGEEFVVAHLLLVGQRGLGGYHAPQTLVERRFVFLRAARHEQAQQQCQRQ